MKVLLAVLRALLAIVVWTTIGAAALAASTIIHLRLPLAREVARGLVSRFVSDEIAGSLEIGRLDRVAPDGVTASHVVLRDADGTRIVTGAKLVLVPDLTALWERGEVRIVSARLSDATVRLVDAGDGLPTFLGAFDAPPDAVPGTGEPLRAVIEGVELDQVTIYGDFLAVKGLRAERLSARGRFEVGEEVRVEIEHAAATLVRPFGFPLEATHLRGKISTDEVEGITLAVDVLRRTEARDEKAHVTMRLASPAHDAPTEIDLGVRSESLTPATLRAFGFEWAEPIGPPLTGTMRLHGPFDRLVVTADAETPAGKARVDGEIREVEGTTITIASDALRLSEALVDGPDLDLKGSVTLAMRPGEEHPRIHAEVDPLVVGKIALPGFVLDGTLESERIRVEKVRAKRGTAAIEGSGQVRNDGGVSLRLRVRVPDVAREKEIAALLPGAHGRLDADLQVDVTATGRTALRLGGSVTLFDVRWGALAARRLVVRGRMSGDPDRPSLDVKVRGEGVSYEGYPLGTAIFAAAGRGGAYRASGEFTRDGQRAFHLDADVKLDREGMVVNADPIELELPGGSWRGAIRDLEVRFGDSVKLGLFRLASKSQRLEARALVQERGDDEVEAQIQGFDLEALHALVGDRVPVRRGFTDSHLVLGGDLSRPDVLLEGALMDGAVGHVEGVNALYAINYRDGRVDLDVEVDLGEHGLVRADGTAHVDLGAADLEGALRRGHYRMNVSAEELDLSLVPTVARAGIGGRLGGAMRVSGDAATPSVSGNYVVAPLEVPGWGVLFARGDLGYTGGLLDVKATLLDDRGALAVFAVDAPIVLDAVIADPSRLAGIAREGPWRLRMQSARRALSELPGPLAVDLPIEVGIDGQIERREGATTGQIRYVADWMHTLDEAACGADMTPSANGFVQLDAKQTQAVLSVFAGKERFASATVTLGASLDAWLRDPEGVEDALVHAKGAIDVPQMERLPFLCEQGTGSVAADVEIGRVPGRVPSVAANLFARFDPRPVRVGSGRQIQVRSCARDPVQLRAEVRATGAGGRLLVHSGGCHGGPMTLDARLPMRWIHGLVPTWDEGGPLDATLTFEDAQLRPFLRRVPGLHGGEAVARGKVHVHGTAAAPRFDGSLEVSGGRVYLVSPGQELSALEARFELRGDWVKVERLSATSSGGTLDASGGVGFEGFVPRRARMALRAIDLPIQREGTELAWLTGSAAVDASIESERARAAVKVHALRLRLPDRLDRTLQPLDPHPEVVVVTDAPTVRSEPYPVDLAIDARSGVHVVRNDLDTDVVAELAVSYVDSDLLVGGYVELLRGDFEVFGKSFTIEQGGIRFDGSAEVNPDIRLVATHRPQVAGGAPVTVTVGGTLAEPEVRFSSEACPGDTGAVTYLISGQCAVDDPELAAESEAAEDNYAAGITGTALGGLVGTVYGPGVGGLKPRFAAESAGSGWATRVKAGVAVDDVLPKWMQTFVRRVYVQGAGTVDVGSEGETTTTDQSTFEQLSPEVLIELYFPYHFVGAGKYAPGLSWGVDVLWEP